MILDLLWRKLDDISFPMCIVSGSIPYLLEHSNLTMTLSLYLCNTHIQFHELMCMKTVVRLIKRSVDPLYFCLIIPPDVLEMQEKEKRHMTVFLIPLRLNWYLEIHID